MNSLSKVLVVDDNHVNVDVLYLHLKQAGYTVLVASDGKEALDLAQHAQPDLIIMDIMMPVMNGFQSALRLKENPLTNDIPIIFMTALDDISHKIEGFKLGGADYITKPFQHREVLARVQAHLTIRKQKQELEIRARSLQEQNEDLDAFAHTVAHDLKNPLQTILTHAELLQQIEQLTPKGERYTEELIQTTLKMHRIIEELQRLAWIRTNKITIKPIHMRDHVNPALSRLKNMIAEYKPEINLPETCPLAQGYGPWVEEVWMNYLSNAMKYGGSPPVLTLGGEDQGNGYVRFWVRDNGRGIPLEDQNHVFEQSVQLRDNPTEGYGLGLSIAKRIVEKLNGEVGVSSCRDQGSEFYFTLPAIDHDNEAD